VKTLLVLVASRVFIFFSSRSIRLLLLLLHMTMTMVTIIVVGLYCSPPCVLGFLDYIRYFMSHLAVRGGIAVCRSWHHAPVFSQNARSARREYVAMSVKTYQYDTALSTHNHASWPLLRIMSTAGLEGISISPSSNNSRVAPSSRT